MQKLVKVQLVKHFLLWVCVKTFWIANPDAGVIYFESESAITKQMVIDRGIDLKEWLCFQ